MRNEKKRERERERERERVSERFMSHAETLFILHGYLKEGAGHGRETPD